MKKTYIIGAGTGRCGTKSLAIMLNQIPKADVSHEFRFRNEASYRLHWSGLKREANKRVKLLKKIKGKWVGDVASYYLNYLEDFNKQLENLKIVYLTRNTEEVVESFMKVTAPKHGRELNHWFSHRHSDFKNGVYYKMAWDRCFPKYKNINTKKEAITKYCTEYKNKMNSIITRLDNIFTLDVYNINNRSKRKQLFDFLEIPTKYRFYRSVKENKS